MSLIQCREKYKKGLIDKSSYIEEMHQLHARLFEYPEFMYQTGISSIEIQDNQVTMTMRDTGIKIKCGQFDKRVTPIEILNFDSYEKEEMSLISKLLEPHMVCFDVGANIGWYSLKIAKSDYTINVYAFEPIPLTYQQLAENVALNRIPNIKLFNLGLSDRNQDMKFYFDPLLSGNASAKNLAAKPGILEVIAKTERMDDVVARLGLHRVDFVKCDVEGAELLVFQGGMETLKKYQPCVFTEMLRKWSAKFNYHPNEIIQLFSELGYRCFISRGEQLEEFFKMDDNTVETNFFFLHSINHRAKIQSLAC